MEVRPASRARFQDVRPILRQSDTPRPALLVAADADEAATLPAPRPKRRRIGRLALAALALLALALGGFAAWQRWGAAAAPAPAYAKATVARATVEDAVSALGNIQPRDYTDVGTQVSGQVRKLHVAVGDRVKAGDPVAQLDPTVYQARVETDQANLRNLKAQLDERQARLTLAEQALRRQQNLRRANATSEELLEQAQADVRITAAQIEALRAQVGQTEGQLKVNEANLSYTRIYAPIAGTVVSITARLGQTLNANQSAPIVLRVADLAVMTVQTQVSEADVGRLEVGQEAYFSTLGDPDRRYTGTLRQVMPTPEVVNNVVLYNALFDVPNPEGRLMTQMTAQVFFVTARADDVLTVPASALRASAEEGRGGDRGSARGEEAEGTAVLVLRPDGTTERRPVEVGVATRTAVEIRSGLEEGEEVVTGPAASGGGAGRGGEQRPSAFRARLG